MEGTGERALVEKLQKRVDNWARNSDNARLSVPLAELRAILDENDRLRRALMGAAVFSRPRGST